MSDLFGTGAPKFQGTGTPDSATVNLLHAVTAEDWVIDDLIRQRAPITGFLRFLSDGAYSKFAVQINLNKYGNAAAQQAKVNEIAAYNYQLVNFWPHDDGVSIKDPTSTAAKFFLTWQFGSLDNFQKLDILTITFESEHYTSPELSMKP